IHRCSTRIIAAKKVREKSLKYGDIIIEKSGGSPTQPVGRVVFFEKEDKKYLFNNFTSVLRLKDSKINFPKYVFYHLFANYKNGSTIKYQNKTTGILNLKLDRFINETELLLPSLETQKQIAKTLDTTAGLLTMRKQQLAELDELIKSIFYNMFGDPVTNEKEWDIKQLRVLSILITKGSSPTWQGVNYTDDKSQVLFITSENVREGYLDFSKRKYLEKKFNEIQNRSILKYGDLLVNIVGASIGRAAVFYSDEVANINQAVALVRCNKEVCLTYLCYYLNSPKALQMYNEMQVDVARANLSLKNIGDLAIIYPPIPLQNQFAEIVARIEAQKALVKKAIDETQYLFDSLISQYFE
ncbi:MAG TPA: hypothetical protein DEH07_01875, partial [Desulfotomaculum sp.]|nr:hypothetical protein [Desulfotomaculum sp.]